MPKSPEFFRAVALAAHHHSHLLRNLVQSVTHPSTGSSYHYISSGWLGVAAVAGIVILLPWLLSRRTRRSN